MERWCELITNQYASWNRKYIKAIRLKCNHNKFGINWSRLTARNEVSFHTALSNRRFALVPKKMGEVGIASRRFWSSRTLLLPLESGLYRDREDPLRSYTLVMFRLKRRFSITNTSILDSFPPLRCFMVTFMPTTNQAIRKYSL